MLIECPLELATRATSDARQAARLWGNGVMPISGGWLEQTQWCLEAVEYVRYVEGQVKEEMRGK